MRLLLVATNRERSPYPVAPVGALMVAAAARQAGHEVALVDMNFAAGWGRSLKAAAASVAANIVRRFRPDAIGFSVRNLDNCFMTAPVSYVAESRRVIAAFRAVSDAPTIAGGPAVSLAPARFIETMGVDYGVVGEGEAAIVALLDALAAGDPERPIRGVVRRAAGASLRPTPNPVADLATLPPAAHDLIDYRPYLRRGSYVSLQTKRGCPFECVYCVYPELEGRGCRVRPPEAVADEIARLRRGDDAQRIAPARHFFFTDSVFNAPSEPARALLEEIVRRRLDIQWTAYCNPTGLDDDMAELMKRSGCLGVELGLDAVTPKMIANLGKSFTQADIARSFAALRKAGLPFAAFLLFGGPGETEADILEAQAFLDSCAPANAVFASFGIRILPGTPIERMARGEGVISADDDLFEPRFYVSPHLGGTLHGSEFMPRLDAICRRREEWSSASDWRRPVVRLIQWIAGRNGARPAWRNIRKYGRHLRSQTRSQPAPPGEFSPERATGQSPGRSPGRGRESFR